MWTILINWSIVIFITPILIGIGLAVLTMSPPIHKISRISFTLAAPILFFRIVYWLAFEQLNGGLQPFILGFVVFIIIGGLWLISMKWLSGLEQSERLKHNVSVSPSEITVRHQTNKNFILKITNNQNFAIFDVNLSVSVNNKTLPLSLIKIEPIKIEVIPGIPFSMLRVDLSNGCSAIVFGSINPSSTREFNIKIEAEKIKTDSTISFAVYDWSLEPSLFDFSTKPFEKFPNNFKEFFGDNSSKESEKTNRVYFQKFKAPINSYFPDEKKAKVI